MTDAADRLAILRATLAEAEEARDRARSSKSKGSVQAAEAHHAAAQKALADAHLEAKRQADEHPDMEKRPTAPSAETRTEKAVESKAESKSVEKPKAEDKSTKKGDDEPAEKPAPAVSRRRATLQEMNQSASTQNVRHTAAFTEKQHSQRRNPKRT
jgi:hypothetical protein